MPPSPTSQAATLSTSSWASGWRGQWQRSTGHRRGRSSRCQQAPWHSPSPSSPSSPSSASASSCTAGDPTLVGSWAALEGAKWPQHCSSSASGCSTSSSPPWRPIATSKGFRRWRDGAAGGGTPSSVTSPDTSPGSAVSLEGTAICQGLPLPTRSDSCVPRRAKPSQSEKTKRQNPSKNGTKESNNGKC